jgi:microcystin-dependent protein
VPNLVLPHTITAGTEMVAAEVQQNDEAVRDFLNGQIDLDNLAAALQGRLVPTGSIVASARGSAPGGWLMCDGAAVSRATYADLFNAISTSYGIGDGSTTFNLPDLRGRVPVGVDGAAARLTANDALGNSGGEEKHVLTAAENGPHFHRLWTRDGAVNGSPADNPPAGSNWALQTGVQFVAGAHQFNVEAEESIGGTGHNTMQPFQIVNYIIKT